MAGNYHFGDQLLVLSAQFSFQPKPSSWASLREEFSAQPRNASRITGFKDWLVQRKVARVGTRRIADVVANMQTIPEEIVALNRILGGEDRQDRST